MTTDDNATPADLADRLRENGYRLADLADEFFGILERNRRENNGHVHNNPGTVAMMRHYLDAVHALSGVQTALNGAPAAQKPAQETRSGRPVDSNGPKPVV